MAINESTLLKEVQDKAKQGDKDALFEMSYRDEEAVQLSNGITPYVWRLYWMGRAAEEGHFDALRIYAGICVEMPMPAKKNKVALEMYKKFGEECRKIGNRFWEAFAKMEQGFILCEALGMYEDRDHIRGVKLIDEAKSIIEIELGKKIGFTQLVRLGEIYGMGYTQEDEEPLAEDLRKAIKYLKDAKVRFPNTNEDFQAKIENQNKYKQAVDMLVVLEQHLMSKESMEGTNEVKEFVEGIMQKEKYNKKVAAERRKRMEENHPQGLLIERELRQLEERLFEKGYKNLNN